MIKNRIESLEEHIRETPEKITIDIVSEKSFYSYRHANRLFTFTKGESIQSFVTKIRHQKAAEYLKYSSKSIFDIAMIIGYESTASFSKAFKKSYQLSPSAFRKKYKEKDLSAIQTTRTRLYSKKPLKDIGIIAKKITYHLEITDEQFLVALKNGFDDLQSPENDFILIWDEDPTQCLFSESRFFIGIEQTTNLVGDKLPTIEGNYAFFDTNVFKGIDGLEWHKLAYLILELDQVKMRDGVFIEYYSNETLRDIEIFYPSEFAIPIQ